MLSVFAESTMGNSTPLNTTDHVCAVKSLPFFRKTCCRVSKALTRTWSRASPTAVDSPSNSGHHSRKTDESSSATALPLSNDATMPVLASDDASVLGTT